MKQFLQLLVLAIFPAILHSQNISVNSFRQLPTDLDARVTYPKIDQNGDKCAIIKIVTSESDFSFDGDMLGIIGIEKKTGEYWLYVPHDAKRITIKHKKLGLLRDFEYTEPIKEATVYELVIETPKIVTETKDIINQYLSIKAKPQGAKIFLNEIFESTDSIKKLLIPGNYKYRITAQYYYPDTGNVFVTPDRGMSISISLKPNFGFAKVISIPKPEARVQINGVETNNITPCITELLKSGEYNFTLLKNGYRPVTTKVTIRDGQTEVVELTMQSNRNFIKDFYKKHPFSVTAGYYSTFFSNSFFKENIAKNKIKRGLGYAATLNVNLFPVFFDLTYFYSGFSVTNIEPFKESNTICHRGAELSLDYIPYTLGVNVYPYFGVGYQYSQLYSSSLTISGIASSNTSLPIAKAGIKFRIKKLELFGEYKNGFDINGSGYASGQIYAGIGFYF